jgi:hypothetical protein
MHVLQIGDTTGTSWPGLFPSYLTTASMRQSRIAKEKKKVEADVPRPFGKFRRQRSMDISYSFDVGERKLVWSNADNVAVLAMTRFDESVRLVIDVLKGSVQTLPDRQVNQMYI